MIVNAYSGMYDRAADVPKARVVRGTYPPAWGTPPIGVQARTTWARGNIARDQERREDVGVMYVRRMRHLLELRRDPWA